MKAANIPVVKVGTGGATGTPDEFEGHFARKRMNRRTGRPEAQPSAGKLPEVRNRSMQDRLADFGIRED